MIELAREECRKRTPYTTSSGVQIGSRYEPPRHNPHTKEDDFWQGVLLGDPPAWTIGRIVGVVLHTAVILILVAIAVKFGG